MNCVRLLATAVLVATAFCGWGDTDPTHDGAVVLPASPEVALSRLGRSSGESQAPPSSQPRVSNSRYIASIIITLFLAVGTLFALRRFRSRFPHLVPTSTMAIRAKLPLDARNSLVLVEVHEQEFVLGVGSHGVSLICRRSAADSDTAGDRPDVSSS